MSFTSPDSGGFLATELKEEQDSPDNAPLFPFNNDRSKCGEILFTNMQNFVLICAFCLDEFSTLDSFGVHCTKSHLNLLELDEPKEDSDESVFKEEIMDFDYMDNVKPEMEVLSIKNEPIDDTESVNTDADDLGESAQLQLESSSSNDEEEETKPAKKTKKETATKQSERLPTCELCGRHFRTLHSLRVHKRSHKVPDSLKCDYCDKICSNRPEFIEHIKTAHSGRRKYHCPHCPKLFATARVRQEHIGIHTGERPFECTLCPQAFVSRCYLNAHMLRHVNRADFYPCQHCEKRFVKKTGLETHLRQHTGEKPFRCEQCGMCYTTNNSLQKHRITHSKVRNHRCDVCGKAFHQKYVLKEHYIKHTGERPYKCDECGNTYPRKKALQLHMQLHSSPKQYVCNVCGKSFSQKVYLQQHKSGSKHF